VPELITSPGYQAPPYQPYTPAAAPETPGNPQATASLVLGIVSLVLSVLFVPAILGVVLGIVGLSRSRRTYPPTGRGAAITGIVLSVIGAVLGVAVAVTASNALSGLARTIVEESRTTAPGDGGVGGGSEAPVLDPEDFVTVDAAQWESIVKDPAGAEGRAVVVFAEVVRFDSSTGADRFLAISGVDQPGDRGELQAGSVFIGEEPVLAGVEEGDVLKVHAVVTDSMELETRLGGVSAVPALTIAQVEDVGLADLRKDFTLGAAARDQLGILSVPVTVTNSGGETFTYSAKVVAESKDGKTSYDVGTVFVENIKPGRTVKVGVDFFEEVPADAVFRVDGTERYIE
jgi:predicted RNA-binding protein with TRAM domain